MNSERRHQLNENELAGALDKFNHSIEPYSKPIALGVAAFFVAVLGYGFYSSTKSDNRSDATLQLIDASITGDTESLATIAAKYPNTSAAAWARLYQGGQQMGIGFSTLYTSRDEAETLLDDAVEAYNQAMELSNDAMIQSRAHYGLAQIAEARGNVEDAIRLPPSLPGAGDLPDLPDLDLPPLDLPMDDLSEGDAADADANEAAESEEGDAETEEPEMTEEPAETEAPEEPATEEAAPEETAAEESTEEETSEPAEEMKEEAPAEEAVEESAAEKTPEVEETPADDEPAASDE